MSHPATSPSPTQNALTRLWKGADSSYGHHFEAVAELRERKRRERESPRPVLRRQGKRGSNGPDPEVSAAHAVRVPVAEGQGKSRHRDGPSKPHVVSSERMSSLRPDDLNVSALPRSPLGHLKTEAVEELLQRAAWNYREALGQNQQLANKVEQLTQRVDELMAEIGSLKEEAARRKNPDELARALLVSAQRTARAERDAARQEAESTLKKARTRAESIERDVGRRTEHHLHELARLEALRDDVVSRLRALLETVADYYGEDKAEDTDLEDAATPAEAQR